MFFFVKIVKYIRLEPHELGKNLYVKIRNKYDFDRFYIKNFAGLKRPWSAHALLSTATSFTS